MKFEYINILIRVLWSSQSTAIGFERGLVLRNLLMALDDLISFAHSNEVESELEFASVFVGLISSRPSVCAEALDRFADLRTLGVRTVYQEFEKCINDSNRSNLTSGVKILLYPLSEEREAIVSLSLLQAASVLLSIWTEQDGDAMNQDNGNVTEAPSETEAASFVTNLANMLLHPIINSQENHDETEVKEKGLASAAMVQSGKIAVSVESVSCARV